VGYEGLRLYQENDVANSVDVISPEVFPRDLLFENSSEGLPVSVVSNERIVKTPETCGGRVRIAGHRVRVQDVVIWYEYQGMTPDEIVSHIPTITLADVHSALAYYFDHVQEIQEDIRADREYADEFFRSNPSLLDAKLKQERLQEAS
jgi:uncharacterized protein (DUF433 family)